MRKTLCSLALSGVLTIAGSAAFAQSDTSMQQPATTPSAQPAPEGHRGMNPDKQAAELTKRLSLSPDQESQIKPILANRQQQMEAIHQDQSLSQTDRMAKMKSLRDETNTKIEAVLNDTQKQQYQAMMAKRQERMQGAPQP